VSRRPSSDTVSAATRGLAALSLVAAIAVVTIIVLSSGSTYSLHAQFQDASGLVTGDLVMMGPAKVGTISAIGLTVGNREQVHRAPARSA
jgi:ABC-type transporter Mla subunit MlaD